MSPHPAEAHRHAAFFTPRSARSRRASSWDRSGANRDYIKVAPGETFVLLDEQGAGCVSHVYMAMVLPDVTDFRDAVIRCYWDGASEPAVEAPMGDFFGVVHGRVREYRSALTAVNGGLGSASHGLNSYFPMPFSDGARITLEHRGPAMLGGALGNLWYHIDYESYSEPLPAGMDRFHAEYRQERPTMAIGEPVNVTLHDGVNLDGADNYVALETSGSGRMVGLVLGIDNVQGNNWYGEGDDMVFVDGEPWPPSIHGTGTEEIFGGGACPSVEYAGPYTGYHLIESPDYDGLVGMYRWFVDDPIHFASSLRWTIEHGHANNFSNGYSSVAFWYQSPLAAAAPVPPRDAMVPVLGSGYEEARSALFAVVSALRSRVGEGAPLLDYLKACRAGSVFYQGDWEATLDVARRLAAQHRVEIS
jgi:D-arabinan exo alpha-(1,3)/(1,5)-arabinofuranosidase (non-reducing end)